LRIGARGDADRDDRNRLCRVGFRGCFSEFGVSVSCIQVAAKIAGLQRGEMPIYEPGRAANVRRGAELGESRVR
jgi:hypothetical protein